MEAAISQIEPLHGANTKARTGTRKLEHHSGTPVFSPHSSIDFDHSSSFQRSQRVSQWQDLFTYQPKIKVYRNVISTQRFLAQEARQFILAYQNLYDNYHVTALGSKLRLAEQHDTGRPSMPNTLSSYIFIVQGHLKPNSHPTHPAIRRGFMPRKFQVTNFPPLPKHSPVEFSQTTYLLGSDHPVFAPGSTPWPVEGPMGNPMHPIQPLLGQGPDQNQTGYKIHET
ncbi:hypothetical protein H4Q26_003106 [Puccinia striiformis f. sp. tritici PST-130]|nr:hypothetical protein H4Q26_003106 [Puccinia striiformis f. sp. tritici PST-130]